MMAEILGLSLHPALGGRPLWLIVAGSRNASEPQVAAAVAGVRLQHILGGFNGCISLDDRWSAFYVRCNEVVVVATFESQVDSSGAQRCAEAARSTLIELVGGTKLSEVTLANLGRRSGEVQVALRKCTLGTGRLASIASGKVDLAAQFLSPDSPADDRASKDIRASNDVTAPSNDASVEAGFLRRSDALSESIRALRLPTVGLSTQSQPAPSLSHFRQKVQAGQRGPLLSLLPKVTHTTLNTISSEKNDGEQARDVYDDSSSDDEDDDKTAADETNDALAEDVTASEIVPRPTTSVSENADTVAATEVHATSLSKASLAQENPTGSRHSPPPTIASSVDVPALPDRAHTPIQPEVNIEPAHEPVEAIQSVEVVTAGATSSEEANTVDTCTADTPGHEPQLPDSTSTAEELPDPTSQSSHETPTSSGIAESAVLMSSAEAAPTSMCNSSAVSVGSSSDLGAAPVRSSKEITVGDAHVPKDMVESQTDTQADSAGATSENQSSGESVTLVVSQSETMSVQVRLGAGAEGSSIEGTLVLKAGTRNSETAGWAAVPASGELVTDAAIAAVGGILVELALDSLAPLMKADLQFVGLGGFHAVHLQGSSTIPHPHLPSSHISDGAHEATRGTFSFVLVPKTSTSSQEIAMLKYTVVTGYTCLPLLKAVPTYKLAFAALSAPNATDGAESASPEKRMQHRYTDIMLRTQLHPAINGRISDAQFLVQLPVIPLAKDGPVSESDVPSYSSPQFRPAGQWNAVKSQILWHVIDAEASGAPAASHLPRDDNVALASVYLAPGRAAEFKCRVPVTHGTIVQDPDALGGAQWHPLQLKASLLLQGVAACPLRLRTLRPGHGTPTVTLEMTPPQLRLQMMLKN